MPKESLNKFWKVLSIVTVVVLRIEILNSKISFSMITIMLKLSISVLVHAFPMKRKSRCSVELLRTWPQRLFKN